MDLGVLLGALLGAPLSQLVPGIMNVGAIFGETVGLVIGIILDHKREHDEK
jgi:hypothetical protein